MKNLFSIVLSLFLLAGLCVSAQTTPKRINGGVLNGKATSLPKPEYPESLRSAGVEGIVAVNVVIDEEGKITSAESDLNDQRVRKADDGTVLEPLVLDPQLRELAENAARTAKFAPTLLSNVPVQIRGTILYNFTAQNRLNDSNVKTVAGGVLNGKAIFLPPPIYPAAAKAVKAGGTVNVEVVVGEDGSVSSASVISGHPLLRSAAEAAAREAKLAPTFLNGQPVKIGGVLTYNFVP